MGQYLAADHLNKKCNVLQIRRNRNKNPPAVFHIDNTPLPDVVTVADLGVMVDSELKFSPHICTMVRKAHTRSRLLLKCFISRDKPTLVKAFMTYVLPIVEYCSTVWSPHLIKDIEMVEAVQRRFTKRLPGLWNVPYLERLKSLGLERLDIRRLKIDLIMTYKILFGLTCLRSEQFFQLGPVRTTRGHQYKLFMPNITSDIRKYFFCSRVLQAWNDLPSDTDFTNLTHFKTALEKVNLSKYCIELSI